MWTALLAASLTMLTLSAEQSRAYERYQALRDEVETRQMERSLRAYIPRAWRFTDPAAFVPNWHIDAVGDHLQAVSDQQIRKLVINIPPGHAKSMTVAVLWPTWQWGPANHPQTRMMFTSYSGDNPVRDAVRSRRVLDADWYQGLWGDRFQLTGDQNVKSFYENDRGGARLSLGKAGATGKRGDWVIVDDPIEIKDAVNAAALEQAISTFDNELSSRVNDPETGAFVIVMQRLNERDLAGHVLERGGYVHLFLPTEFEPKRRCTVVLNGKPFFADPRTKAGELLWKDRFTPKVLYGIHADGKLGTTDHPAAESTKAILGSFGFAGQHQQRPIPLSGALVKRDWFQFYRELPGSLVDWLQSWDMTFGDTKGSDYVCAGVWARKGASKYLVYRLKEQLSFPATLKAFASVTALYPQAHTKLVEKKANGAAVIATLKDKVAGIIAVDPKESKESRLHAVSPTIEAHNVFLPHPSIAPWVEDYVAELITFPKAAHDDQVDMTTQALLRYQSGPDTPDGAMDIGAGDGDDSERGGLGLKKVL